MIIEQIQRVVLVLLGCVAHIVTEGHLDHVGRGLYAHFELVIWGKS